MGDKGGGGAGYINSPQQQELFNIYSPLIRAAANYGMGNLSYAEDRGLGPNLNLAQPQMASLSPGRYSADQLSEADRNALKRQGKEMSIGGETYYWVPSGYQSADTGGVGPSYMPTGTSGDMSGGNQVTGLWNIPSYNVPNPEYMMPTAQTMNSLSPDVWAGILQPYQMAQSQLMETLGSSGSLGSAKGGLSGNASAGLGKFWAQAAPEIGLSAWNMISPALQTGYGAELQRNQALWGEQLQQAKYPWQAGPSFLSMSMPTPYVQQPGQSSMSGFGDLLKGIGTILPFF